MTDGGKQLWLFRCFHFFVPPGWRLPVVVAAGAFFGIGLAVFHVSGGTSYLSANSTACINCHLMSPQFARWSHASHRDRATCVQCHQAVGHGKMNSLASAPVSLLPADYPRVAPWLVELMARE